MAPVQVIWSLGSLVLMVWQNATFFFHWLVYGDYDDAVMLNPRQCQIAIILATIIVIVLVVVTIVLGTKYNKVNKEYDSCMAASSSAAASANCTAATQTAGALLDASTGAIIGYAAMIYSMGQNANLPSTDIVMVNSRNVQTVASNLPNNPTSDQISALASVLQTLASTDLQQSALLNQQGAAPSYEYEVVSNILDILNSGASGATVMQNYIRGLQGAQSLSA